MSHEVDLSYELEKLKAALDSARRFLPPHLRDQLEMLRRAMKRGAEQLQTRVDAAEDGLGGDPGCPLFGDDPLTSAETLVGWARGEDPARVARVLEAIRGGARFRPLPDLLRAAA